MTACRLSCAHTHTQSHFKSIFPRNPFARKSCQLVPRSQFAKRLFHVKNSIRTRQTFHTCHWVKCPRPPWEGCGRQAYSPPPYSFFSFSSYSSRSEEESPLPPSFRHLVFALTSNLAVKATTNVEYTLCLTHTHSYTYTHTLTHTHTPLLSFASKLQLFTYLLCAYGNEMANKRRKRKEKLRWLTEVYINDVNTQSHILTYSPQHWLRSHSSLSEEKQQFLPIRFGIYLSQVSSTVSTQLFALSVEFNCLLYKHLFAIIYNLYLYTFCMLCIRIIITSALIMAKRVSHLFLYLRFILIAQLKIRLPLSTGTVNRFTAFISFYFVLFSICSFILFSSPSSFYFFYSLFITLFCLSSAFKCSKTHTPSHKQREKERKKEKKNEKVG